MVSAITNGIRSLLAPILPQRGRNVSILTHLAAGSAAIGMAAYGNPMITGAAIAAYIAGTVLWNNTVGQEAPAYVPAPAYQQLELDHARLGHGVPPPINIENFLFNSVHYELTEAGARARFTQANPRPGTFIVAATTKQANEKEITPFKFMVVDINREIKTIYLGFDYKKNEMWFMDNSFFDMFLHKTEQLQCRGFVGRLHRTSLSTDPIAYTPEARSYLINNFLHNPEAEVVWRKAMGLLY